MWYHHTQDMFTHQRYSTYTLLNPQRPFMLSHHIHLSLFLTLLVLILLVNLALIQKIASKYFVFTSEVFLKILPYILLFWKESIFFVCGSPFPRNVKTKNSILKVSTHGFKRLPYTNRKSTYMRVPTILSSSVCSLLMQQKHGKGCFVSGRVGQPRVIWRNSLLGFFR